MPLNVILHWTKWTCLPVACAKPVPVQRGGEGGRGSFSRQQRYRCCVVPGGVRYLRTQVIIVLCTYIEEIKYAFY